MEIDELRKKLKTLENDIEQLLRKFEKETEQERKNLYIFYDEVDSVSDNKRISCTILLLPKSNNNHGHSPDIPMIFD